MKGNTKKGKEKGKQRSAEVHQLGKNPLLIFSRNSFYLSLSHYLLNRNSRNKYEVTLNY